MKTKKISYKKINLLFILDLNNIWNDSKYPLILNIAPLVKHTPSY